MSSATRFSLLVLFVCCAATAVEAVLPKQPVEQPRQKVQPVQELSAKGTVVRGTVAQKNSSPRKLSVVAIQGEVVSTRSRWVDASQLIVTDVAVQVAKTSDTSTADRLTFTAPGGEIVERNLRMTINAIPIFRTGQRIAVSLDRPQPDSGNKYRYRTHISHGVFGE